MNSFWGEGSSDAEGQEGKGAPASEGDATWTKSVANGDAWVKPGGDYDLQPLASSTVSLENKPQFGSSLLTVLVNAWIADPSTNHGVIVIGDERAKATAIRFSSRENGDFESWPTLKLFYQGATSAFNKEINAHNLQVYPDHSSTDLMIRNSDGPVNGRVELYSITGALLFSSQQHLAEGENRITTDIEGSGVYLYRVISSTGVVSGKFLIQSR